LNVLHLLTLPPEHPSTVAFWKETTSSLDSGQIVSAYFLHEGASALLDPRLSALAKRGLRLFACPRAVEHFAPQYKLEIVLGGPGLLAELIERCALARSFYSA